MNPGMANNALHSSASKEHYTPPEIVEAARAVMGEIDLDPATCRLANTVVKAKHTFTDKSNGFRQSWAGNVFLNPPGGKCDAAGNQLFKAEKGYRYADGSPCTAAALSSAKVWWRKLALEFEGGAVQSAIFIGFSLELLQVTQVGDSILLPLSFPICYPSRRVAYYVEDDSGGLRKGASPTHASFIAFLSHRGLRRGLFQERFCKFGKVVEPMLVVL